MLTAPKKSKLVILVPILFALFQIASMVFTTIAYEGYCDIAWFIQSSLMIIMSFALYFTYQAHVKNVMKPLLGAALMLLITYYVSLGSYYLQYIDAVIGIFPSKAALTIFAIAEILLLVIVLALNVNHYLINGSHHSSPVKVKVNKWLYIAYINVIVIRCVCIAILGSGVFGILGDVLGSFADVFSLGLIIYIEHSMDEFRLNREAAGWTEKPAEETPAEQ